MRITALLGAGAFLDIEGKSTPFLTQKVIEIITQIRRGFCKPHYECFLQKVSDNLNKY